jgi:hypothetical protein
MELNQALLLTWRWPRLELREMAVLLLAPSSSFLIMPPLENA